MNVWGNNFNWDVFQYVDLQDYIIKFNYNRQSINLAIWMEDIQLGSFTQILIT
jgi:hypothetical protein